jgi:PPIC-type PPIASE domain
VKQARHYFKGCVRLCYMANLTTCLSLVRIVLLSLGFSFVNALTLLGLKYKMTNSVRQSPYALAAFIAAHLLMLSGCAAPPARHTAGEPTEAQLREEYARWASTRRGNEYRTRHILVSTQEAATAVLQEIKAGAPFAAVASRVSLDTGTKAKGGDLGWVLPSNFVAEFRVAFRDSETGLYPQPVRTPFGWHVILVEEVRPVRIAPFEEMRSIIKTQMKKARAAPDSAAPLPSWTPEQWDALFATALHTAGGSAYVYSEASYVDLESANKASKLGLSVETRAKQHRARNLIDVEPELRFALARLYQADEVSQPVVRMRPDGRQVWTVIQLERREDVARLQYGAPFRTDAAAWVAKGLLPSPEQILKSPEAKARIAYWRATSVQLLASVSTNLSPDVEYGNLGTPLLDAIIRKDMAAANELVRRGANVNRCGVWGCPLVMAAKMEDAAESMSWVEWLLKNGAVSDGIDSRGLDGLSSALTGACWRGHFAVVQRLVQAGASLNGVPDSIVTPLEAAASNANKSLVEWLIARGASVLPRPNPRWFGVISLYSAAQQSKNEAFIAWTERTILNAAAGLPDYRFSVFFEQEGRRIDVDGKGIARLKSAPFKMVFTLPESASNVQVGASLHAAWLEEFRATDLRNAMFRAMASGALTDASQPDSQYLLLSRPCKAGANMDRGCDGAHMSLYVNVSDRNDFHERRTAGGKAYVRAVTQLLDFVENKSEIVPVQRLAGQTLYLIMGIPLSLGGPTGERFVQPRMVSVQFTR